ncbi:MAG: hypothetical protein LBP68_02105 [Acidobacteriota bacterium]|jgi:hypothetical protein|nr:hypothetical protein [Acidobacteriota bacterium]
MMKPFDIFITYVSWKDGGKHRPVLVFSNDDSGACVFGITTQYENKSETIRAKYFRVDDWRQAGLDRQSYVDTFRILKLPPDAVNTTALIGRLTAKDKQRFIEFLRR